MNEYYNTTDFYLTVFLEIKLDIICDLESIDRNKFKFVFEHEKEEVIELVKEYHKNANIPIISFKDHIRNLKSRMMNYSHF